MKKIICFILTILLLSGNAFASEAEYDFETDSGDVSAAIFEESEAVTGEISVSAPSAILMEKETGTVIFEKEADKLMQPASVTKVMTILLIVEAVENGTITLDDTVTVSAYAASMGGSQVFLEEGESMTVRDMLKSIVVSSANDAAVAMAEHLAGAESAFVSMMNNRASELGMENTTFCNCTGLLDQAEHLTTARDIAIMSRELIRHDWIKEYTTIWMDTIRNGEFGLSNTNKLVRYYEGATGLKTGFTSTAMYCLSATAEREGVEFIAVVMGCETSTDRFESAKTLLSYGFSNFSLVSPTPDEVMMPVPVDMGKADTVQPELSASEKLLVAKAQVSQITREVELCDRVKAPVSEGDVLGKLTVKAEGETLVEMPIVAGHSVERLSLGDVFLSLVNEFLFGKC
ncbi:MAG: D-alanyl-D-alanine carboxypeptidase [Ruminococcaceae bacterium]|nr:D-alanyl-D-alanine carboxypeptidase [Oscillospiraceae bacterium]